MSICASGSSTTQAGVPAGVIVDNAYMQSILPPEVAWLFPYLPYSQNLTIGDVSAFCAADPPTFTVPTALEIASFLSGGVIGDYLTVQQFITDITHYYLWYRLCKCSSGSTPAPATGPAAPTGAPAINPPQYVAPPSNAPCQTSDQFGPNINNVTTDDTNFAIDQNLTTQFRIPPWTSGGAIGPYQNATSGILHAENQAAGSVHTTQTWTVSTRAFVGATVHKGQQYQLASGQKLDIPFTIPAGDVQIRAAVFTTTTTATNNVLAKADIYCGTAPGGVAVPCCTPDPQLTGMIAQLLNAVTLIQRQAVPFGYVPGTVHTGLSGAGTLSITGLIGCSVSVTTLPGTLGEEGTAPAEYFDLGWITFGTPDGYPSSHRLEHNPLLLLPARCSAFTDLAYDLHPGVVVTITELLREP